MTCRFMKISKIAEIKFKQTFSIKEVVKINCNQITIKMFRKNQEKEAMNTKIMELKETFKMIKIWLMSIVLIAKSQMILLIPICRSILISIKSYRIMMIKTISIQKSMKTKFLIKISYNQNKKSIGLKRKMKPLDKMCRSMVPKIGKIFQN